MTVVRIGDAAGMLADLVRRAASGEEVFLAHNGQPVARTSPFETPDASRKSREAIERLKELSEGQSLAVFPSSRRYPRGDGERTCNRWIDDACVVLC